MKPDLTWLPNDTAFGAAMGDASVHVGGKNPANRFVPNVNMGKFGDEAWVNMNAHNVQVTNEKHEEVDDKVQLTVGNETHRVYTLNDMDIEWEVEFAQKPSNNLYEYKLDMSAGVTAYKQILSQEDIDNGAEYTRPDAEGSYAFYYNKRNNKYKTGKIAEIYRPKLIDALGAEAWCDMDIQGNILTITMPQDALDNMTYPVILDPVLGYDTVGSLSTTLLVANAGWTFGALSDATGGEITAIHAAIAVAAGEIKMAVTNVSQVNQNPDGLTVLDSTASVVPTVTDDYSVALTGTLLPDTEYGIGLAATSITFKVKYNNVAGLKNYVNTTDTYANMYNSPLSNNWSVNNSTKSYSVWADYEAAATVAIGGGLASDGTAMFLASGGSSEL